MSRRESGGRAPPALRVIETEATVTRTGKPKTELLLAIVGRLRADFAMARSVFQRIGTDDALTPHLQDLCLLAAFRLYEVSANSATLKTASDLIAHHATQRDLRSRTPDGATFDLYVQNIPHWYREAFDQPFFERCRAVRDRRVNAPAAASADIETLLDSTAMIVEAMVFVVTGERVSERIER